MNPTFPAPPEPADPVPACQTLRTPKSASGPLLLRIALCVTLVHVLVFAWISLAGFNKTPLPPPPPNVPPRKLLLTPPPPEPAPAETASEAAPAKPPPAARAASPPPAAGAKLTAPELGAPPPMPPSPPAATADPVPAPDALQPAPVKMPARTEADRQVARQWLTETNNRPGVLVTYDPAELVQLLQRRRGTLLASEVKPVGDQPRLEFCLAATPRNGRAMFIEASGVAHALVGFGVVVHHERGPLAELAADLPAYFGQRPFTLQFIPDLALAEGILAEVARALRAAAPAGGEPPAKLTVEGRLTAPAGEARFTATKLRSAAGERSLSE